MSHLPALDTPGLLDLTRYFIEEGADKFHRHRYDVAYDLVLSRLRHTATSVLEVGVYKGQSLRAWARYFDRATVTGVDISPRPKDLPAHIVTYQGDQGDRAFLEHVASARGPFDVIIEDGSHAMHHQKQCAEWLWPHVRVGGVYVCEDLHTSELIERDGPQGDEYRRRFNPTHDSQSAREFFLDDARQRCARRGDRLGGEHNLLGDRVAVFSTALCAWVKVHDGTTKAWP